MFRFFPFLFCLFLVFFSGAVTLHLPKKTPHRTGFSIDQEWNPVVNPKAVIIQGNSRFSVLTDRLIRMEYSVSGTFEDDASFFAVNRYFEEVPFYNFSTQGEMITLQTNYITVIYKGNQPFQEENLRIIYRLKDQSAVWFPGMVNNGSLHGTIRTLDGINGATELNCSLQSRSDLFCTEGVVSQSGYAIVNDSGRPLMGVDPEWGQWVLSRSSHDIQDFYFFGHGLHFRDALRDFTLIGGKIPLPPRFLFGIFFSRYWAYSQEDEKDLIEQYEVHSVPLDIIVTDMDWHETFYKEAADGKTDQAGQPVGWTGYTWDSHLFPVPQDYLNHCKKKGIRVTLNLHPASGVQPHELLYPEMAMSMGIDPSTGRYVPFDIVNSTFAKNLHDIMLRPLNDQGIGFWWLDWQQWETTSIPGVNPTFWLNHVFFNNFARWNLPDRPILLHRWGGLGNHRYPVGFSGDVVPSWASLNFQVYFTSTAANVGYGYWSHDIGGHTEPSPPELYTRWVQWGILSPLFRPHCTKSPDNDRRIWVYPEENFEIMRDAFIMRSQLIPYIYTASRITYDSGVPMLVRPMYYDYPEFDESYRYQQQYLFGEQMLSAPITTAMNTKTELAAKDIWIPPGQWFDWFRGELIKGPTVLYENYSLSEFPLFVKSGSIIPYYPLAKKKLFGSAGAPPNALGLRIFPLDSNRVSSTKIYDDDGYTVDYRFGKHCWTTVTYSQSSNNILQLEILPVQGSYPGMATEFTYELVFVNVWPPEFVTFNSRTLVYDARRTNTNTNSWRYDGDSLSLIVTIGDSVSRDTHQLLSIQLSDQMDPLLNTGIQWKIMRAQSVKVLLDYQWGTGVYQEDYTNVIDAALSGQRMSNYLEKVFSEVYNFHELYQKAIKDIENLSSLSPDQKEIALARLRNY